MKGPSEKGADCRCWPSWSSPVRPTKADRHNQAPNALEESHYGSGSVEDMPEVGRRLAKVAGEVVDDVKVAPPDRRQTVVVHLQDRGPRQRSQDRRVAGAHDLAAGTNQLVEHPDQHEA